jgi:hypothetical protein
VLSDVVFVFACIANATKAASIIQLPSRGPWFCQAIHTEAPINQYRWCRFPFRDGDISVSISIHGLPDYLRARICNRGLLLVIFYSPFFTEGSPSSPLGGVVRAPVPIAYGETRWRSCVHTGTSLVMFESSISTAYSASWVAYLVY